MSVSPTTDDHQRTQAQAQENGVGSRRTGDDLHGMEGDVDEDDDG
jgi:hypothetical protein